MKGKILVIIQFGTIILLLADTNLLTLPWWSKLILFVSGLLAFWAMFVIRFGNFNVVPEPVKNSRLITRGPYKLIRHPMYASILIFIAGILLGHFSYYKLIISLVLVIGLIVKMRYEEQLLSLQHIDYNDYIKKTKRVIPFVW